MFENDKRIQDYSEGRKNNFDLIRLSAALMVLYSHSFPVTGNNPYETLNRFTKELWSFGSTGVAIFFILSGFLVSQSFERSKSLITFAKARLLRIVPALLVVMLLSAFVLGPAATELSLSDYFSNSATYRYFINPSTLPGVFLQNPRDPVVNASLWTIRYEVICYALLGCLGLVGLLRFRFFSLFLFCSCYLLLCFKMLIWDGGSSLRLFGLNLFDLLNLGTLFSAGMAMYSCRKYIPINKYLAAISVLGIIAMFFVGRYSEFFIVFGGYLIMYVAFEPGLPFSQAGRYGDFSYGLYLYAYPVQQCITLAFGGRMSPYLNLLLAFPIVVAFAVLSWHLIEKRFLQLKKINIAGELMGLFKNGVVSRLRTVKGVGDE